jgi:hypothetical protein
MMFLDQETELAYRIESFRQARADKVNVSLLERDDWYMFFLKNIVYLQK